MEGSAEQVVLIPCSGIGKVHGLLAREGVCQALRQAPEGKATTMCLALLVVGDAEARQLVGEHPVVTVDGCPKLCAYKNVELAGGRIARSLRVLDVLKEYKGCQPGTATTLSAEGWKVVDAISSELLGEVQALTGSGEVA